MPRKANEDARTQITARDLHAHDYLVLRAGGSTVVEEIRNAAGRTLVKAYDWAPYAVDSDYPVTVHTEHACDCHGSGIFRGGGVVENGVYKGYEGPHFACGGKGWQDRQDVIRNITYWNKYARIYA
jgi:hypothetical protein